MPDLYMPDVKVEIAFNAGYTTPAASRVWTDVSQYVELDEGIDMEIGRQDERATADANTLTLTLDNSDGRFTAGRSGSPYFPNVKVGRPIRVTSTPVGGTASTRFVGFVDEWPVEWEGSDAYAKAKVRATSRLSRLGLTASLSAPYEYPLAAAGPTAFWSLSRSSGSSTAHDSVSGRAFSQVLSTAPGATITPVSFGQDSLAPTTDDSAASFAAGYYLTAEASSLAPGSGFTIRALVKVSAVPAVSANVLTHTWAGVTNFVGLLSNGRLFISGQPGSAFVADGVAHDVFLKIVPGVSSELFVDGVSVSSGTPATLITSRSDSMSVGEGFVGSASHVGFFPVALASATIAEISSALISGYAGDRTDQRVTRLLGWAGVASSEVTVQTGAETMTYQKTGGQSVVDALRECESTEGGVLFDGRDGNVTFHNRSNRYLKTTTATLNMAAQHVERDYSPKLDRSTLTNDVTVSNPTTEQTARSTDTASQTEYGIATSSATSVASTYDAMQQKAAWTVASYAEPRSRVPSLTVDVLAHQGLTPSMQTLLGVNVSDLLAVTNAPTQAATTSPSYFVEGYTERIGPQSYEITYNLSPTHPALSTFVLDDTTRGVLDSSYVLAL